MILLLNLKTKHNRCMCVNYQSLNDFQTYDRCKNTV